MKAMIAFKYYILFVILCFMHKVRGFESSIIYHYPTKSIIKPHHTYNTDIQNENILYSILFNTKTKTYSYFTLYVKIMATDSKKLKVLVTCPLGCPRDLYTAKIGCYYRDTLIYEKILSISDHLKKSPNSTIICLFDIDEPNIDSYNNLHVRIVNLKFQSTLERIQEERREAQVQEVLSQGLKCAEDALMEIIKEGIEKDKLPNGTIKASSKIPVKPVLTSLTSNYNDRLHKDLMYYKLLRGIPSKDDSEKKIAPVDNTPPKGIQNIQRSCFMNAALQILYAVEEFRDLVVQIPILDSPRDNYRKCEKIRALNTTYYFQRVFYYLLKKNNDERISKKHLKEIEDVDFSELITVLSECIGHELGGIFDFDSVECLELLLSRLSTHLVERNMTFLANELDRIFNITIFDNGKIVLKKENGVDSIVESKLQIVHKFIYDINVPIDPGVTLITPTLQYVNIHRLIVFYRENIKAEKEIWNVPQHLPLYFIIHIPYYSEYKILANGEKTIITRRFYSNIQEEFSIPQYRYQSPKTPPCPKEDYTLVSIMTNSGGDTEVNMGHYYAFIKKGEKWIKCNDSEVTEVEDIYDVFPMFTNEASEKTKEKIASSKYRATAYVYRRNS
ncbi:hypothetical protein NEFER01_1899 [Nematocida sp. LUAm1]|nr:hypothetical protein NEFER02_1956 [Nematocida sp. LUAm2]KAI5179023.1 hypothetical protein NEFER01_1899 [Nematocida sp. LUAm1]